LQTLAFQSSAMTLRATGRRNYHSRRIMAKLFQDRGVHLDRTYQLNVGGNMDFKNMLERDRLGIQEDFKDKLGYISATS
jgi:myo-inositol-1-phosphate synthase